MLAAGCSDSSDEKAEAAQIPEPTADTSYLDELAAKQGIALEDEPEQSIDDEAVTSGQSLQVIDDQGNAEEVRDWQREEDSKSLLGRSRDKAKDLRDQIQGGTSAEEGLAYTLPDEEYASSSGMRWEMPGSWSMAVPARGRFAEMYIKNPLGNASVSFAKDSATTRELIRVMQGQIIDPMGGRADVRTTNKVINDHQVTMVDLSGTFLDPGSKGSTKEQIFYAMHAAIFDLGDQRIVIKMWGPQDTVERSTDEFDRMIDETSVE